MLIHIYNNLYIDIHIDEEETKYLIQTKRQNFYFSTSHYESYIPFNNDYGPINIYNIFEFCVQIHYRLTHPKIQNRNIVYYIYNDVNGYYLLNTLLLFSVFILTHYKKTANEVILIMHHHFNHCPTYFIDCVTPDGGYISSLTDCIHAISYLLQNNITNVQSFNYNDFMYCLDFPERDMTIIPHRIIAMIEPNVEKITQIKQELVKRNVKHIIQLNDDIEYDKSIFIDKMTHNNMSFEDCSTPSIDLAMEFVSFLKKTENDIIAIHCKAGLGRTGLFVCIYLMITFGIDARKSIAMLRMYRSGSIMGYQGHFLEMIESTLNSINYNMIIVEAT